MIKFFSRLQFAKRQWHTLTSRLIANIFTLLIHKKKLIFFPLIFFLKCWEKDVKIHYRLFQGLLCLFFYFKDSVEQSYLLTGCRWLQPNVRHKYRWSRPAWHPFPGSFATSLFHSGDWTCWRNKCSLSLCRVLSASLWRVKDAVPVTAAAQEEKSPWILPRAGRQKGKPQTQQIPRD